MRRASVVPPSEPSRPTDALARAVSCFAAGDDRGVLTELADVLRRPRAASSDALRLATNAAIRSRAWAIAADLLDALHARDPADARLHRMLATAHNNAGREALAAGDREAARRRFDVALALAPDLPEALYNRLQLAQAEGALASAYDLALRLAALAPDDGEAALLASEAALACADLAAAQRYAARLPETAAYAARVALVHADLGRDADALKGLADLDAQAATLLADRLRGNGATAAARQAYAHAAHRLDEGRAVPGLRCRIASRLALPWVVDDAAGLASARQQWIDGLAELETEFTPAYLGNAAPALEQLAWSNFLLAYQGENDCALQARYAALLRRMLDTLAPRLLEPPRLPPRARPRVVLVSSGFRECTVGAYFGAWIGALVAAGWDTHVIQLGPRCDDTTQRLLAAATQGTVVDGPLDAIVDAIRARAADVVVLPEIGMDMRMQALATAALGRRMVAAWGHPVTTGYRHFDGYLTASSMEPRDAQAHYVEPLLPLPGLGTRYTAPLRPRRRPRSDLGLPRGRLYAVPQSAFKLHPEDDAAIAMLAARDPAAHILLVSADRPHAQRRYAARLARAVRAAGGDPARLVFLPSLPRERFLEVLATSDVMLDTGRWSGGNTTLDALRAGLPVVACPGALMRGRQSAAMLTMLGLDDELVCSTRVEQVERALAIADDHPRRARIARTLDTGFAALIDGAAALHCLVERLDAVRNTP